MPLRRQAARAALLLALACGPATAIAQVPNSVADQIRRKQEAAEIQKLGVTVDWRTATWTEIHDWRLRIHEAKGVREHCGSQPDWRTYPLPDLRDWHARCWRAAALVKIGVQVDWKQYSIKQLDELRSFVQRMNAPERSAAPVLPADMPPGFDPDAIIKPVYIGDEARRTE